MSEKAEVALDGWAGRTNVPVRIVKRGPRRTLVEWLRDAYRHRAGTQSYVPNTSLVEPQS